jgi:hypothetical protein
MPRRRAQPLIERVARHRRRPARRIGSTDCSPATGVSRGDLPAARDFLAAAAWPATARAVRTPASRAGDRGAKQTLRARDLEENTDRRSLSNRRPFGADVADAGANLNATDPGPSAAVERAIKTRDEADAAARLAKRGSLLAAAPTSADRSAGSRPVWWKSLRRWPGRRPRD